MSKLRISLAAALCAALSPTLSRATNVLLIVADDQSYPHAGAYGCPWVDTPGFDRVASEGILFNRCYTPNAKSAPPTPAIQYEAFSPTGICTLSTLKKNSGRRATPNSATGTLTAPLRRPSYWSNEETTRTWGTGTYVLANGLTRSSTTWRMTPTALSTSHISQNTRALKSNSTNYYGAS